MHVHLTYVHHSSFVLRAGERTLLFDYPADEHLPEGAERAALRATAGRDITVFISHSHDDHCSRHLAKVAQPAESAAFVLSDDVPDLKPDTVPTAYDVLIVEPDESYAFHGMEIRTAMSNDLGVAFFIDMDGLRIYYGGDLARWDWDGASASEQAFTARYFQQACERVKRFDPHIAFTNLDGRLPGLAGGLEFAKQVNPQLMVPMHTFGNFEVLDKLRDVWPGKAFYYERTGQTQSFDIDIS